MQVQAGVRDTSDMNISGQVVVFSEVLPSWLLLLDGRTACPPVAYVEREARWFRRSTNLTSSVCYGSMEAMLEHPWVDASERTFLLQGSTAFCAKVMEILSAFYIPPRDRILVVSSGRMRRSYEFEGFRWTTVKHSGVGGVTTGLYSVGCSPNLLDAKGNIPVTLSTCERHLVDLLKVDGCGIPCPAPKSASNASQKGDPRFPIPLAQLLGQVLAPSVFSSVTGWVTRKLSLPELGAALDLPVGSLEAASTSLGVSQHTLKDFVFLPPLKVLQSVIPCLFAREKGVIVNPTPISAPSDDPRLSLSTFTPNESAAVIAKTNLKSVKSDDAATDEDFWNFNSVTPPDGDPSAWKLLTGVYDPNTHGVIFDFLRKRMSRQFSRNVTASARRYLQKTYTSEELRAGTSPNGELDKDLAGMKDAIHRSRGSSFWDWNKGSFPFFWQWQPEVKKDMRDGTPIFVKGKLPRFSKPQRLPSDESVAQRIMGKVNKVRLRTYIAVGLVLSLTSYFHVPKGDSDIRIVYDLTACGLNEALWAPTFWMPTIANVLDCAIHSSWFGDVDAGEMFLNYPLDEKIRPYAGVDVSWAAEGGKKGRIWERWTRMAMGLLPSPWVTTRLFAWAMEIIKGDRNDPKNPFHWTRVVLNCPGDPKYDPTFPRLYKWNEKLRCIAGDCRVFVDDLRSCGATKSLCKAVTHRVETMMGYLGLQDATRKRRPDSQSPGEWTGSIVRAIEGVGLFVTVSQAKWEKAQNIITSLLESFSSCDDLPRLDLKELEKKVGFLVHLAMAYPLMFPFLKGFYLTMNSWRSQRDRDGWKMSKRAYDAFLAESRHAGESLFENHFEQDDKAPKFVDAVPLLHEHLLALNELFSGAEPTLRLIRGSALMEVGYVFGDASGSGFGSTWTTPTPSTIGYRFGVWGVEGVNTSSNFRELRNLVETLEHMGSSGHLEGREIFIFTDNMVSETVASKGSSKSPELYALVLRIYKLEMKFKCCIHFVHVAGTRMIQQGSDGLSRGDMYEGIMKGESMLSFIPLHRSATDRARDLLPWITSWAVSSGNDVELLSPEGWFERGHDFDGGRLNCDGVWMPKYRAGTMVWAPPPAVARHVIEELRQARQKRQNSWHVFVCPRLMYTEWRRHLYKSADLILEVKAGSCPFWPASMHETLIIAIYFPYLSRFPWELRKTRLLVGLARKVSRMLKDGRESAGRDLLSEFCLFARRLDRVPDCVLRKVLCGRTRFVIQSE